MFYIGKPVKTRQKPPKAVKSATSFERFQHALEQRFEKTRVLVPREEKERLRPIWRRKLRNPHESVAPTVPYGTIF